MKQTIIGSTILLSMLALLAVFPLSAGLLGEKAHALDAPANRLDPWFLKGETAPAVLVYFGYVGCTSICIPALNEITPLYRKIQRQAHGVPFYFVNLNPTQDREWVEPFARSFHPDFKGVYADIGQVNRLEKDFNLAITGEEEMSHSSNLYLMVRNGSAYELKRIYATHPYHEASVLDDIQRYTR
ncbi:MAG: SCO family protein [Sulfuricurvum sp.]